MYVFSLKLLLKNTTLSVVQGCIGWDCLGAALSCVSLGSSSRARGQEKHFQCSQGAERTFTQGELSSGCRIHSKGNSSTWIPDKEKHFEEHFPPSSAPLKSLAASLATSVQVRCTILCTSKREPTPSQMWTYSTSGSEYYQIPRWQLILWLQLL